MRILVPIVVLAIASYSASKSPPSSTASSFPLEARLGHVVTVQSLPEDAKLGAVLMIGGAPDRLDRRARRVAALAARQGRAGHRAAGRALGLAGR